MTKHVQRYATPQMLVPDVLSHAIGEHFLWHFFDGAIGIQSRQTPVAESFLHDIMHTDDRLLIYPEYNHICRVSRPYHALREIRQPHLVSSLIEILREDAHLYSFAQSPEPPLLIFARNAPRHFSRLQPLPMEFRYPERTAVMAASAYAIRQ